MIQRTLIVIGTGMNCYHCKHSTNHRVCKAFDWIPDDIWFGRFEHTKPYPNDRGFQFELNNPEMAEFVKWKNS